MAIVTCTCMYCICQWRPWNFKCPIIDISLDCNRVSHRQRSIEFISKSSQKIFFRLVFLHCIGCFAVTYKWRVLPLPSANDDQYEQTPYHRYGHTAVAYADRAYIFGGRNDKNGACNILFCFDAGNILSLTFYVI